MSDAGTVSCPRCGEIVRIHRNPLLTVDVVIDSADSRLLLIERRSPPHGWALPGGFVDYGESLEEAAVREAREETCLELTGLRQFRAYSDPGRDPRHHTVTVVFAARGVGEARARDDAKRLRWFAPDALPRSLAFDHGLILADYLAWRQASP